MGKTVFFLWEKGIGFPDCEFFISTKYGSFSLRQARWASGIRFCLNFDVREDKIAFRKERLNLYSKFSTAANAHLVESLLADLSE